MSLNRKVGYLFGVVFLLVGIAGFFVAKGVGFTSTEGKDLIIFEVNPLHNIVHALVGLVLIGGAAAGDRASRSANIAVGAVYGLVGVVGFFITDSSANLLALDIADNLLHLGTAVVLLAVALRGAPAPATRRV